MKRIMRSGLLSAVIVLLVSACASMTGRSTSQWWDDKETTARVKTALAATQLATLTRVDVDTVSGVVYLKGVVESSDVKRRAEEVAMATVPGPTRVVNNLTVSGTAAATTSGSAATASGAAPTPPAGHPVVSSGPRVPTATPGPSAASPAHPIMGYITKLERVDREAGAGDRGPWAAFGRDGKRVATVYAVPLDEMRSQGLSTLAAGERRIEGVSVVPHPAERGQQYLVVLWHVSPEEAARLR